MRPASVLARLQLGRSQRVILIASLIYVIFFVAWLVLAPVSGPLYDNISDIISVIGPTLLTLALFVNSVRLSRRNQIGGRWTPSLLAVGVLLFAIGDLIWAYEEIFLNRTTPFPSPADFFYLGAFPVVMAGIMLTPVDRQKASSRARIALDGALMTLIATAFSWFFVIGPTIESGGKSLFHTLLSAAYPLCDLLIVACVVMLWMRVNDPLVAHAFRIIAVGLLFIIVADTLFSFIEIQQAYEAAYDIVDISWVIGFVVSCLGILVMQSRRDEVAPMRQPATATSGSQGRSQLIQSLLPYGLVPLEIPILLYCWFSPENGAREIGILVLNCMMVGVVALRQIVSNAETATLQRETMEYARRLEQLATTDPLTELANHRTLMSTLDQEIERAERYGRHVSILFLDLDHFKTINDSLGHPNGDAVLTEVAHIISTTIRGVDTAGRWGGEEFLIILPEADREAATTIAERVRSSIASRTFAIGGGAHITCSIGVATYGIDAHDRDLLVSLADEALYAAKRLGRNQVRTAGDPATTGVFADGAGHDHRDEISLVGMTGALTSLVAARDQYTSDHSDEVGKLAMQIAVTLGLTASEAQTIGQAGQLHDIGKVAVPDAVLRKPGPLTPEEWSMMRLHPVVSAEVISHVPALRQLVPIVRGHHERFDGGGYPDGLRGEDIPLGARILAVVDSYSAMTTDRPYRPARSSAWAMDELRRNAGSQFDPAVVAALEQVLVTDPFVPITHDHLEPAAT